MDGDERRRSPEIAPDLGDVVDLALGAGVAAARLATHVAHPFVSTVAGALRRGAQVSQGWSRAAPAWRLADRGEQARAGLERAAAEAFRRILPRAVEAALAVIDVTEAVRAHVDLEALAKALDVDAVVAGVDIDAAVARVDLDAIVDRLDLDALVARVDLNRAVSRVDVDAIIDRADLDRVAARLDLDAIIDRADLDRAVARVDLGAIVQRVDPDEIVARVDIEAALDRLDLAGIARQVIEAIDLAGILRESAGAVSSQAARVVRTEGMNADDSVARFVDRVLRRPHPGGAVTP